MTGVSRHRRNKPRTTPAAATANGATAGRRPPERYDHGARVSVDEQTWQAFKQITADSSISQVLGDLVTRHVHHTQARQAKDGQLEDRELLDALDRAQELQRDLGHLLRRIEDRIDRTSRQATATPSPAHAASLPFPGR